MTLTAVCTNFVRDFSGVANTRDYMRDRYAEIEQFTQIKTYDSVVALP